MLAKMFKAFGVSYTNESSVEISYRVEATTIDTRSDHTKEESSKDKKSALYVVNDNLPEKDQSVEATTIDTRGDQTKEESSKDKKSALYVVNDNLPEKDQNLPETSIALKSYKLENKLADKKKSALDGVNAKTIEYDQIHRKRNQTVNNQPYTAAELQRKRMFRTGIKRRKRSNVWPVIFLTFSKFLPSCAQNIPIATVVTTPVVFGEDVTFQCSYDIIMAVSALSTSWLKGQKKETIIFGNNSTKVGKYTPAIHHVANKFQYLLTIHNVSVEDLDIYSCDFDFQYDLITFTLDGNVSFIYIPDNNEIVFNISESKLKIWIQMVYPQPQCTGSFNEKDISELMKKKDKHENKMYSTIIEVYLSECCGNLNISCIIGSRSSSILTEHIQKCAKETECSHGKERHEVVCYVIVLILILVIAATIAIIYRRFGRKREGQKEDRTKGYTEVNGDESTV